MCYVCYVWYVWYAATACFPRLILRVVHVYVSLVCVYFLCYTAPKFPCKFIRTIKKIYPFLSYLNDRSISLQDTTDALPCHINLPVCLWIMDPHSRAPKNTSRGNEVLPHDTMHHTQRPCYQLGSPCQDPAGNRTTWRSPDHRKETQTAVAWLCLPFIRSGQNHLARHSERGKKLVS